MITAITISWHIDDVKGLAQDRHGIDITDEQACEILQEADNRDDANIGICWDVLDIYLCDLLREKTEAGQ